MHGATRPDERTERAANIERRCKIDRARARACNATVRAIVQNAKRGENDVSTGPWSPGVAEYLHNAAQKAGYISYISSVNGWVHISWWAQ